MGEADPLTNALDSLHTNNHILNKWNGMDHMIHPFDTNGFNMTNCKGSDFYAPFLAFTHCLILVVGFV